MAYRMPRTLLACFLGALTLLVTGGASAQTTTLTTNTIGGLTKADFTFYLQYDQGNDNWVQMNTTEKTYFFNRARCECAGDETNLHRGHFRIAIQPATATADKIRQLLNQNLVGSGTARLYAGSNVVNCLAPASLNYQISCLNLIDPNDFSATIEGGMSTFASSASRVWYSKPIPVAWLYNATKAPVCSGSACNDVKNCTTNSATVTIYFWAQTSSQQTPDMQDS
jgi:hypothetical protein